MNQPMTRMGLALLVATGGCGSEPRSSSEEPAAPVSQASGETEPAEGADPAPGAPQAPEGAEPAGAPPADGACQLVERGFGPEGEVPVRAEEVVSGLEVPWGILFLENGDMLVTERAGRVRLVRDGRLVREPVATVRTSARGEGGLLGIAAHPDFADNRLFYVYVTVESGNRVEVWKLGEDARSASRERVLIDGIPAARFHNGGRLRLGPDRMLYVGTGDAGDPQRSQDRATLAGKILRLRPDGSIPTDNPFGESPVYVLGIRNTQGFDWREDGTLLVTDHGPSGELGGRRGHDEASVAAAGTNLGWPTIFGCREREGLRAPSLTWRQAAPPGGAAVYTGDRIPEWRGMLVVGTLGSKHLHTIRFDGARVTDHAVYLRGDRPDGLGRLRDVIMGPDGELYVTTSNCDGRGSCPDDEDGIYRIVRSDGVVTDG